MAERQAAITPAGQEQRPARYRSSGARLFSAGARAKLSTEGMGDIFVTDTIQQASEEWPRLHVVSIASLVAGAGQRVTSERFAASRT